MFWFLLSKSTCCYISFWTSLYFALTRQSMVSGDSFQKVSVSSNSLGTGAPIRIPRRQSAFRSNSKDKKRHTLNFAVKHWYHLAVLTRSGFCFLPAFTARLLKLPLPPKYMPFILCILFHLPLPLPASCSQGFYQNMQFLWVFYVSRKKENYFHHDHFRAAMLYIPLLHVIQPSKESLKLLVVGYCTFSCVCEHLNWEHFLLAALS